MGNRQYDVVVIGAALGGVISAALLAKRGYRVAVMDALDQAGGRSGGTEYNGYWLDWGHRDGHGYGDLAWIFNYGAKAAREVGIEVDFKPWATGNWRTHSLPAGVMSEMPQADALGEMSADPIASYRKLAEFLGMKASDEIGLAVKEAMDRITSIPDDEAWNQVEVTMGDWLDRNVANVDARNMILQMLENTCASPAEHASLGRFVFQSRGDVGYATAKIGVPDDSEVGGMQGSIAPWVRAIERLGGEMWLGWKPTEILVENRQVKGVVAVNRSSIVEVLEAPVVITDFECWELPTLLDESLLPRDYMQIANEVRKYSAQVISWWAGLKRLPRRRVDGRIEDHLSWQRLVYGEGAVKSYYGGYHFPSSVSSRSAPPGKHLMVLTLPTHGEYRWSSFHEAKKALDVSLDYLRDYYIDLDDCAEWGRYQYMQDQVMGWNLKPVRRLPIKVSTLEGLYVASATTEGKTAWTDREAEAAIDAVNLMEQEFGVFQTQARVWHLTSTVTQHCQCHQSGCPVDNGRGISGGASRACRKLLSQIDLGRLGDGEKYIGRAALFLASEDSDYLTGQTLNVDGGQIML